LRENAKATAPITGAAAFRFNLLANNNLGAVMIAPAAMQAVVVMAALDHNDPAMMPAAVMMSAITILDNDFRRFSRGGDRQRESDDGDGREDESKFAHVELLGLIAETATTSGQQWFRIFS
jgi:hypothetical protein